MDVLGAGGLKPAGDRRSYARFICCRRNAVVGSAWRHRLAQWRVLPLRTLLDMLEWWGSPLPQRGCMTCGKHSLSSRRRLWDFPDAEQDLHALWESSEWECVRGEVSRDTHDSMDVPSRTSPDVGRMLTTSSQVSLERMLPACPRGHFRCIEVGERCSR